MASSTWIVTTSPMTRLAEIGPDPTGITCRTRHSSAKGTSASRGGATRREGTVAIPTSSTSLSSGGSPALVRLIASAWRSVAALMTNSPSCSMFTSVSFFFPSRESVGEITTTGGLAPKAL